MPPFQPDDTSSHTHFHEQPPDQRSPEATGTPAVTPALTPSSLQQRSIALTRQLLSALTSGSLSRFEDKVGAGAITVGAMLDSVHSAAVEAKVSYAR